jgi:hypothetical protein
MHLVTQALLLSLHGSVCVSAGEQRGRCWRGSVTAVILYLFVTFEQVYIMYSGRITFKRVGSTTYNEVKFSYKAYSTGKHTNAFVYYIC